MIIYKTDEEIRMMRESSRIVARILDELRLMIKPGLPTSDLDACAERKAREFGAKPAFKGYRGYPASLCISINEEIIHGIPSGRALREGDIVSLDFGLLHNGFYGDAARTYPVGNVAPQARKLIQTAERALHKGLEKMVEGNRISDISAAVQEFVEAQGFSVIRSFVGHGIGHALHEEPQVPNFGFPGRGPKIKRGLVLAIEPMIAAGDWEVEISMDGWTAMTKDRSLAAHYEQTVALTDRGVEILSADEGEASRGHLLKEQPYA